MPTNIGNVRGPTGLKGSTGDKGFTGAKGDQGPPGSFVSAREGIMSNPFSADLALTAGSWTTLRWNNRWAADGLDLHSDQRGFTIRQTGTYFVSCQSKTNTGGIFSIAPTVNNSVQWALCRDQANRITQSVHASQGTLDLSSGQVVRMALSTSSNTNAQVDHSFFSIIRIG